MFNSLLKWSLWLEINIILYYRIIPKFKPHNYKGGFALMFANMSVCGGAFNYTQYAAHTTSTVSIQPTIKSIKFQGRELLLLTQIYYELDTSACSHNLTEIAASVNGLHCSVDFKTGINFPSNILIITANRCQSTNYIREGTLSINFFSLLLLEFILQRKTMRREFLLMGTSTNFNATLFLSGC